MAISAIPTSSAVAKSDAVARAQSAPQDTKQQSPVPQDKVTISAEALARQAAPASGPASASDKDHDGDSK